MAIRTVRIGDLQLDQELSSVRKIAIYDVHSYIQAMKEGAEFPKMIIEQGTNRICSGMHRHAAYMQAFGPDHQVQANVVRFHSDNEFWKTFRNDNIHGRALTDICQKHIALKLKSLGESDEEIASLFQMSVKSYLGWIGKRNIIVVGKQPLVFVPAGEPVPVKGSISIPPDKIMQDDKYEDLMAYDRSIRFLSLAQQFERNLKDELLSIQDPRITEVLIRIADILNTHLSAKARKVRRAK